MVAIGARHSTHSLYRPSIHLVTLKCTALAVADHTAEHGAPSQLFACVKCSESLDVLEVYHALDQSGLNYGPAFRAVERGFAQQLSEVALLDLAVVTAQMHRQISMQLQLSVANFCQTPARGCLSP